MCLDVLREEAMSIPFYICQPREDGKARLESILFTSTHYETEYDTQPLWHAITKLYLGAQDLLLYLQVYLSDQSSKN